MIGRIANLASRCLLLDRETQNRFAGAGSNSVKVVRGGLGAGDIYRKNMGGFNGNDSVLVLQDPFDHQELL